MATERGLRGVGIVIRTGLDVEPVEALVHSLLVQLVGPPAQHGSNRLRFLIKSQTKACSSSMFPSF